MTLAAIEAWLRSRRGLVALWCVTTLAVTVTTVLMQWGGVPGWDDAAHAYKVLLLRDGSSVFWDNLWYGGSYGAVTYGVVFYWLAQYVPGVIIVVLATGTLPVTLYLYQRSMWGIDDVWPAWAFVVVMTMYQAHGQDPFVVALALTMAGLALLARGRPFWAALPVTIGIFTNPMGLVVVAVFMVTDIIARPETRRRYLLFVAAVAPAAAARIVLGWAFTEPGGYLNETSQLMVFLGFALVGIALAGVNAAHPRRPFMIMFLVYAVLCVGSFVTPGSPLGNNIGRFFMVFGLSLLLLLRHTRFRRPLPQFDLAWIAIALFAVMQFSTVTAHFWNRGERPQTTRAYFAPALRAAARLSDPNHRIHVVALRRHWEALYFPEAGYPITRGWYRQADAIHNRLFYTPYDAAQYIPWLRAMGVEYIFLPRDELLDPWSRREARLLQASSAFELVDQAGVWSIYQLRQSEPLLVRSGAAEPDTGAAIERVGHESVTFTVDRPGAYLLKFTWCPYWVLEGGPGTLRRGPDRFVELHLEAAGTYTMRIEVSAAKALDVAAAKLGL